MQCKFCKTQNDDNAVYCQDCGKRIDGKIQCPACHQLTNDAKYCVHCGARLDGKKVCPNCETVYEGAFCPECGTKQSAKQTVKQQPAKAAVNNGEVTAENAGWKKILNTVATSLLLVAVVASLIFVFFIGVKIDIGADILSSVGIGNISAETNIFDYFGNVYEGIEDTLNSIVTNKAMITASILIPLILGTLVAAGTLIAVVVLGIFAIVKLINKLLGKEEQGKNAGKFAISTVFTYLCGSLGLLALNYTSVNARTTASSYVSMNINAAMTFDDATVAGIVISLIFLAMAIACKLATMGKTFIEKPMILKLCFTAGAIVFLSVALSFATQGAIAMENIQSGSKIYVSVFASGFATLIASLATYEQPTIKSQLVTSFSMITVAQAVELTLIILIIALFVAKLKDIGNTQKNGKLSLSIACVAMAVVYLIFTIVGVSQFIEAMGITADDQTSFNYAAPIVTLVFCVVNLIAEIVFISIKKQSAATTATEQLLQAE